MDKDILQIILYRLFGKDVIKAKTICNGTFEEIVAATNFLKTRDDEIIEMILSHLESKLVERPEEVQRHNEKARYN